MRVHLQASAWTMALGQAAQITLALCMIYPWSDEDWEIWADVLRCSGKNKDQKRRLEMFRRFKYLRQQGQWVGTTPNEHAKSARMSARPKSSGGKPE